MSKAKRFLLLILCVAVLGLWTTAHADLVTVGIYLTGMVPAEDGSWRSVTTDGDFRVYQNGQEVGTIAAGRETLILNSMDRIRIEPVPQSFAPGWDLSTASLTAELSGTGTQMIPVTVYERNPQTATPDNTAAASEDSTGTPPSDQTTADSEDVPETDVPVEVPVQNGPVQTPTLPPYTGAPEATPEPIPAGIQGNGSGSLRVQVFSDKNRNGAQTSASAEEGVKDITVYLLNEAGELLSSSVTGTDGMVVFSNLPDGNYRTKMYLPDGWCFTPFGGENSLMLNAYGLSAESSQTSGVITVTGGAESEQGIGINNKAVSMGGFIWLDETVDGLYKDGEARIPGVRIQLKHTKEDLVYETESGEDGTWKIGHLYPGVYTLSIAWCPEGLMPTRYTQSRGQRSFLTSDNTRRNVDTNGTDRNNVNIGFRWETQITGRCYLDANYNGKYDEGEAPLPGVKVHASFTFDDKDAGTAVSGADGIYTLSGLRMGNYNIQVILPDDGSVYSKAAPQEEGGNLFGPRGGDRRDQMLSNVSLGDAEMRVINVGAIYPATLTGTVYYDDNFSAGKDGNEKAAVGFTVTILDADGNVAATDKTNANGVYKLTGLKPGEYSLRVQAVKGYAFTKLGEGNVILNRTQGQGYSEPFRVQIGENITGRDIGMIRPGTVKGTVFADRNDNGMRDKGEEGLQGVIVRLMHETEGEAFSAEIGADGGFLFDAVMPGRYYVEYTLPEKAVFAKTADGGNEIYGEGRTCRTESFDFVTGETRTAPLCGALLLGRIDGTAWHDHDGDGIQGSEEMLSGVTVSLVPSRNDLETITVVTDETGSFVLDQLHPDTYQLTVKCPDGYVLSRTDYLALPLKAGVREQTVPLEVQMGSEWVNQATGAVLPASISGRLWMDENNNGLFDEGERTPAGYTVYVIDEYTGKIFDAPVTDAEGCFSAAGMIPGNFTVSMNLDERTLAPKAGDSVLREENGALVLTGIRLQENEAREGLLLGIVRYTEISGQAWIDRGEIVEALACMQITLKDLAGNVIATAETDGTGAYRLQQLMPGSYVLEAVAPEGCVIIEPGDPWLSDTLRSVITHPANRLGSTDEIELKMDQDLNRMDIGCVLPGRLGDYCWLDLNGDGLQAGDEPGIANVRIELLRDGNVVAETVTNQYGFYRLVDLYPATYVIKVYAPDEVKPTRRRTDLPMIASVLEESDEAVAYSVPLTVESNRALYEADLGFVCRKNGVLPAGAGQGASQNWIPNY